MATKSDEKTIVIRRKVEGGHAAPHGGSWKVAYADFMTAMMALFLLLWLLIALKPQQKKQISLFFQSPENVIVMEDTKDGKPLVGMVANSSDMAAALSKPKKIQLALAGKLKDLLGKDQALAGRSGLKIDEHGVSMEISSAVLFEPGTSTLTPEAKRLLDGVADILMLQRVNVYFRGHTDDQEFLQTKYPNKWEFSAARAAAALRYITAKFQIPPLHLEASGYGDSRPNVPNTSPENRAQNRRMEIYYSFPDTRTD